MAGLWKTTNSTTVQLNKLESVWIVVNATAEKTSNLTHKVILRLFELDLTLTAKRQSVFQFLHLRKIKTI